MLKVEVDKHGNEVDRIIACGTREDILIELSAIIAAITREMAHDLGYGKELINLNILGTVTYGVNMAVADLGKKEASTDD